MGVEIEVKAWVDDEKGLKEKLDGAANYLGAYVKEDSYWQPSDNAEKYRGVFKSGIRIRKENWERPQIEPPNDNTSFIKVCYKNKEVRNGIEVNDEREFDITNQAIFEDFLKNLGFEVDIYKTKQGWAWDYDGITVELSMVSGLGWFIELEILSENRDNFQSVQNSLITTLESIGIKKSSIEGRYYTEMLRALKAGKFRR